MLVEAACRFVDGVDDDQSAAGDLHGISGAGQCVEQQAGAESLAVQAAVERESCEQDRWDAVRALSGSIRASMRSVREGIPDIVRGMAVRLQPTDALHRDRASPLR